MTGVTPFDSQAEGYDREEAANPIRLIMRERSLALLDTTFPAGADLLDVGCGTGTEAIWLARRGRRLTAVDPSPAMLEVLAARSQAAGVTISSRRLSAAELGNLVEEQGAGAFDGVYSSFGAINAEPSIAKVVDDIAVLVRPGGRMVLGVMNRWCLAETAAMLATGRPRAAFRRHRRRLNVAVGTTSIDVTYPSWRELRRALTPRFRILHVEAVMLLLLPYAWPALERHPRFFKFLAALDRGLARRRPWAWVGDHLAVVAERYS